MADKAKADAGAPKKKAGIRWGRIFFTLIFLGAAGAAAYAASWFNARRFFLVVDTTEVRVAKGRMLPFGHEPFVPAEVELRRAYESFTLPSGMNVPRGETQFSDRVELDQALFRVLKDAIAFSLAADNKHTPEHVARYLKQIKAVPGTSVSQQLELVALERDAAYLEARLRASEGVASLKEAARLFRESSRGQGGRERDGELRARTIESVLERLAASIGSTPEKTTPETVSPDQKVRTATTTTSTSTRDRRPNP